jgi:glycosyltransferase involved in cell wall biosynthesis
MSKSSQPLVSVIIYNYNYGRFLSQCLDSVFNQTYSNIEVIFSDNASTDNSWQIAQEYFLKHPEKMYLARNHKNFGATSNLNNCLSHVRGDYFVILASDDVIAPDFIKITVSHLETHLDAGLALVHNATMTENNEISHCAPFYNVSCKIPAPKQAAVYMMASINPTLSQIIYRSCMTINHISWEKIGVRFQSPRMIDFDVACKYAVIYLKDALVYHRVHGGNDATFATENLMDVLSAYVMNFDFEEKAKSLGLAEVAERLPLSIEKNGRHCLRYCTHFLRLQKWTLAKRYFYLSYALYPDIEADPLFQDLKMLWMEDTLDQSKLQKILSNNTSLLRNFSYSPPEDSIHLINN